MRQVGFRPADEIIDQLRELHAPVEHHTELYCEGCSVGFEGEEPEWPCRTAALVYAEAEVTEVKQAAEWLDKWYWQMHSRNPAPRKPWPFWAALHDNFIADMVFPKVSAKRSEITYTYTTSTFQAPTSKRLLEDT